MAQVSRILLMIVFILFVSCGNNNDTADNDNTPEQRNASALLKAAEAELIALQQQSESLPEEKRSALDDEMLELTDFAIENQDITADENEFIKEDYREAALLMEKQMKIYNKYGLNTKKLEEKLDQLKNELK